MFENIFCLDTSIPEQRHEYQRRELAARHARELEELAERTRLEALRLEKRTVWVLTGEYDYEGDTILAVFDHQPLDSETFIHRVNSYDSYSVKEWELSLTTAGKDNR